MLGADIRIAVGSARFHVAAVKIGLSAGECGMSYLLPRYVGAARVRDHAHRPSVRRVRGRADPDSSRWSLPDDALIDTALEIAEQIVANSPFSMWMTKQIVWANLDASSFDGALELENRTQILATMTADSAEAIRGSSRSVPPSSAANSTFRAVLRVRGLRHHCSRGDRSRSGVRERDVTAVGHAAGTGRVSARTGGCPP